MIILLLDRASIYANHQNKQRNNNKSEEMSTLGRGRKTWTAPGDRHLLDRKEHNCLKLIQKTRAVIKELAKLNKEVSLLELEAFGNNKGESHDGGEFVVRYGRAYVNLDRLIGAVRSYGDFEEE